MTTEPFVARMWIGGRPHLGTTAVDVANPADPRQRVGVLSVGDQDTVDAAVIAADEAFAGWSAQPASRRAEAVASALPGLAAAKDWLAQLLVRENGKVLAEAGDEIARTLTFMERACAFAREWEPSRPAPGHPGMEIQARPRGVAAVIAPWNAPVILSFRKAVPAILMGNTVVLKPATSAPCTVIAIAERLAGVLPPGVLNVVAGPGNSVGMALAGHPLVRYVGFTGGIEAGRAVLKAAAGNIKAVAMELGGNDPALVLKSATVDDRLAATLLRSAFRTTGQVCFATKRVYVEESAFEPLWNLMCKHVAALRVGEGLNPESEMGPLNNAAGLAAVRELLAEAAPGAEAVYRGEARADPAAWESGYFHGPVLVANPDRAARLVTDEQFGPVLPIMRVADEAEAVAEANRTEFGLRATVWGEPGHARCVAAAVQAGVVGINCRPTPPIYTSFPGVKQSGLGRASLHAGFEEFVDEGSVLLGTARP